VHIQGYSPRHFCWFSDRQHSVFFGPFLSGCFFPPNNHAQENPLLVILIYVGTKVSLDAKSAEMGKKIILFLFFLFSHVPDNRRFITLIRNFQTYRILKKNSVIMSSLSALPVFPDFQEPPSAMSGVS
jgi:hypothetical protein